MVRKIIAFILYLACVLVGCYKFGYAGGLLAAAAWATGCFYCWNDNGYVDEEDEPEHDSCEGCKHNLGGGCCKLNVEDECAAGGGYEMWED